MFKIFLFTYLFYSPEIPNKSIKISIFTFTSLHILFLFIA